MALYPIYTEDKIDLVLHKGVVIFISDDENHDLHQETALEVHIFYEERLEIQRSVMGWQHWTVGVVNCLD